MTNFFSFFQRVLILLISVVKVKVMGVKVPGPALCNQVAQNVPTLTPLLPFTGRQTLLRPDGFLQSSVGWAWGWCLQCPL